MAGSPFVRASDKLRDAAGLRRELLAWYRRNRRPMPWRETRDPYRVWVSEIMLQQTQVATATPYYERFMERFPDVRALARAPRDEVLAAWAGLGYYRRARHLHEAAGIVVREHAGRVPSDARAFGALPGVGRYTLGAVLSIGFGASLPVLDGNVARVLARLSGRPLALKRPADAKVLWAMAEGLLPVARAAKPRGRGEGERVINETGPGDLNQALMELGAIVCTPRAPRCEACPLRRRCRALATGRQETLPPAVRARASVRVRRAVARVTHRGRMLVVRREGALLAGLWEPPGVELARGDAAGAALARVLASFGVRATLADRGERVRHTITHRDIAVQVWDGALSAPPPRTNARLRWAVPGERALALTALARRVIGEAVDAAPRAAPRRSLSARASRRA